MSHHREKSRLESNVSMYRVKELQKSSGENNITLCEELTFEDEPIIVVNKENVVSVSFCRITLNICCLVKRNITIIG